MGFVFAHSDCGCVYTLFDFIWLWMFGQGPDFYLPFCPIKNMVFIHFKMLKFVTPN
jgi:hypothetical protein